MQPVALFYYFYHLEYVSKCRTWGEGISTFRYKIYTSSASLSIYR